MSDTDLILRNLQSVVQTDDGRCRFVNAILAVGLGDGAARLAALKVIPYAAYLKTGHWKATSREAKERVGNRCQLCNGTEKLEAHHRTYARRGEEQPQDLTVLCNVCHGKYHDKLADAVKKDKPISDEPPPTPEAEIVAMDSMTDEEQNAWLHELVRRKRIQQGLPPGPDYKTLAQSGT